MKTVLLIDDEPDFRELAGLYLASRGWRVLQAHDGEVGLSVAREQKPDVVVCDLLMPRVNGFQVCRTLSASKAELGDIKIVVTSGSGYDTDRNSAKEAGAHSFLLKPIRPSELHDTCERLVSGWAASEEAAPAQVAETRREGAASGISASQEDETGQASMRVRFWGVRGSIPCPGPGTVFYGGNTSCVEVRAEGEIIVLDAGSGIRLLGRSLSNEFGSRPLKLTVLISHTHWDHIQGFPFFEPAYNPHNHVRILGYEGAQRGLEKVLFNQMESPFFPVDMERMPSSIEVKELREMQFAVGAVQVRATFLNHPGICVGYRLTTPNGSVSYLPDNEPFQRLRATLPSATQGDEALQFANQRDQALVEFIQGSDVLIIDSQYDDAEYQAHVGWGHGCVDDVVALALMARIKKLFLFHHDPNHDDQQVGKMVAWARELVAMHGEALEVEAAREGFEVVLQKT